MAFIGCDTLLHLHRKKRLHIHSVSLWEVNAALKLASLGRKLKLAAIKDSRKDPDPHKDPDPSKDPDPRKDPDPVRTPNPARMRTPARTPNPARTQTPARTPTPTRTPTPARTPTLARTPQTPASWYQSISTSFSTFWKRGKPRNYHHIGPIITRIS